MYLTSSIWLCAVPYVFVAGVFRIMSSLVFKSFTGGRTLD